ncbi:hypothetical protein [Rhodopila sp.]|uniref:hypothetical protein n=1 Tax=Rhodopila sp. TaxID=2480087 RepID=UPI003D0F5ABB
MTLPAFADDTPAQDKPAAHHARMTWEERFTQANLAHDGHLTLEEAKHGYHAIARHFGDVDVDGKGYVTENDIRAWHASQKTAREHLKAAEDPLRPRNAFQQHAFTKQQTFKTSADQIVPGPAASPRQMEAASDKP